MINMIISLKNLQEVEKQKKTINNIRGPKKWPSFFIINQILLTL